MNRYRLSLPLLIVLLMCWGCTKTPTTLVIPKHNEALHKIPLSKLFHKIDYIALESKTNLGNIKQVAIESGKIAILDDITNRILVFDMKGKELYTIPSVSDHSYLVPEAIQINSHQERLYVLASGHGKMIVYNLNTGEYIKEIKSDLLASDFVICSTNCFAFYSGFNGFSMPVENNHAMLTQSDSIDTLLVTNEDKIEEKQEYSPLIVFTDSLLIPQASYLYAPSARASIPVRHWKAFNQLNAGEFSLTTPYNDTVYKASEKGVEMHRHIDFGDRAKNPDFIDLINSPLTVDYELSAYLNSHEIYNVEAFAQANNLIFVKYKHKGCVHFAYYSRKKSKLLYDAHYTIGQNVHEVLQNNIDGFPIFSLPYSNGELFYNFITANSFLDKISVMPLSQIKKQKQLIQLYDTVEAIDNPLIILAHPK